MAAASALGLPGGIGACLFDLDGVLTRTATIHAEAWKQTFDAYLRRRSDRIGERFRPFDAVVDYDRYVDGRPRFDGVRAFLASRGIQVPEGSPDDGPAEETVCGIGNRKNDLVLQLIKQRGVETYSDAVSYLQAAHEARMPCAVVTSSANAKEVLRAARIEYFFAARIDGVVGRRDQLRGKPDPDYYLAGARALGVAAGSAAVFEDALAGVEAGRAGRFGYVVGVDRAGQAEELRRHGADVVVRDLSDLLRR